MSTNPAFKTFNTKPSLTQQHFRPQCDIKEIIRRSRINGGLPPAPPAQFGDFTGIDFQNMQNKVAEANQAFMQFPPSIRYKFRNNPAEMIAFLENPENKDEAVKIGLVNPPPEPIPPAVGEVVPATT